MRLIGLLLLISASLFAAGLPGNWIITSQDEGGSPTKGELILTDKDGVLGAKMTLLNGVEIPVRNVKRSGDAFTFDFDYRDAVVRVSLALDGDKLKGKWDGPSGEGAPVLCTRKAEAGGRWTLTATTASGNPIKALIEVKDEGGKLSGMLTAEQGGAPMSEIVLTDAAFSFKLQLDAGAYVIRTEREGEGYKGTFTAPDGRSGTVAIAR